MGAKENRCGKVVNEMDAVAKATFDFSDHDDSGMKQHLNNSLTYNQKRSILNKMERDATTPTPSYNKHAKRLADLEKGKVYQRGWSEKKKKEYGKVVGGLTNIHGGKASDTIQQWRDR